MFYCITQQRQNIILLLLLLLLKYLSTVVRFGKGFNNIEFPHDLTSRPGFTTVNSINQLIFLMETRYVVFEVGTELLIKYFSDELRLQSVNNSPISWLVLIKFCGKVVSLDVALQIAQILRKRRFGRDAPKDTGSGSVWT
jgi:hypothetical protein